MHAKTEKGLTVPKRIEETTEQHRYSILFDKSITLQDWTDNFIDLSQQGLHVRNICTRVPELVFKRNKLTAALTQTHISSSFVCRGDVIVLSLIFLILSYNLFFLFIYAVLCVFTA